MQKRSPIRSCIGCRVRKPQPELTRLAIIDGNVVIDRHASGRGAWICANSDCMEAAGKTRAFSRGFRSKLPDPVIADTLLGWLGKPTH